MQVRPAARADVDAVLDLWAAARSAAASTPDDAEAVVRLLEDGDGALIVAEADGRIVGALVAGWDGWRGTCYRLAVLPAYRRPRHRAATRRGRAREPASQGSAPRHRARRARRSGGGRGSGAQRATSSTARWRVSCGTSDPVATRPCPSPSPVRHAGPASPLSVPTRTSVRVYGAGVAEAGVDGWEVDRGDRARGGARPVDGGVLGQQARPHVPARPEARRARRARVRRPERPRYR